MKLEIPKLFLEGLDRAAQGTFASSKQTNKNPQVNKQKKNWLCRDVPDHLILLKELGIVGHLLAGQLL